LAFRHVASNNGVNENIIKADQSLLPETIPPRMLCFLTNGPGAVKDKNLSMIIDIQEAKDPFDFFPEVLRT
jgi:hypothetical protein